MSQFNHFGHSDSTAAAAAAAAAAALLLLLWDWRRAVWQSIAQPFRDRSCLAASHFRIGFVAAKEFRQLIFIDVLQQC